MRTALWILWVLFALMFFLLSLWAKLEQFSSKTTKHGRQASDFFRQGIFVSFCVAIAFAIDLFVLEDALLPILPDFVPIDFARIILLPVILYVCAMAVGGTKAEHIKSAPKVSMNRSKSGSTGGKQKGRKRR